MDDADRVSMQWSVSSGTFYSLPLGTEATLVWDISSLSDFLSFHVAPFLCLSTGLLRTHEYVFLLLARDNSTVLRRDFPGTTGKDNSS